MFKFPFVIPTLENMVCRDQTANPVAVNRANRMNLIPGPNTQTVRRIQLIGTFTSANYVAGQNLQAFFQPAPAGIITRLLLRVTASIGQGVAETQTRVQNGGAALFSNVLFTDTSNQTRINAPSWYLNLLSGIRRRRFYGAARTNDINNVFGMGAAFTGATWASPATLSAAPPANGSPNYFGFFEIPLAYGPDDLRGAMLAGLVNSSAQLTLTVNPNFFVTSTDTVNIAEAAYQSSSAQLGKIGNVQIQVYQEYIDQIGGLPLPMLDLATIYLLQVGAGFSPVASSDLSIPYANYKYFLSTIFRYNNSGVFNLGSDINYVALRTANATDLIHVDPLTLTQLNREWMGQDLPAGYYTINHRQKPLFTNQYGNLNLIINPSVVTGSNSTIAVGYEQLQLLNQLPAAGAIPTGG